MRFRNTHRSFGRLSLCERRPLAFRFRDADVEGVDEATETLTELPARFEPNGFDCDRTRRCPAYADAVTGKRHLVAEDIAVLAAVVRERDDPGQRFDARRSP